MPGNETLADARTFLRNTDVQITMLGDDIGAAATDARKLVNNVDNWISPIAAGVEATLGDSRKLVNNVNEQVEPLAAGFLETAKTATRAITRAVNDGQPRETVVLVARWSIHDGIGKTFHAMKKSRHEEPASPGHEGLAAA